MKWSRFELHEWPNRAFVTFQNFQTLLQTRTYLTCELICNSSVTWHVCLRKRCHFFKEGGVYLFLTYMKSRYLSSVVKVNGPPLLRVGVKEKPGNSITRKHTAHFLLAVRDLQSSSGCNLRDKVLRLRRYIPRQFYCPKDKHVSHVFSWYIKKTHPSDKVKLYRACIYIFNILVIHFLILYFLIIYIF